MIELALRKRAALHKGEIGLFTHDPMSEEEFKLVAMDSDVLAKLNSHKHIEQIKFLWALATKVADSVDGLHDKEDAMDFLCVKARYMRTKLDPRTGKLDIVRKSLSRASYETLHRLIDRIIYIVVNEIIPGLDESKLRTEILEMVT